MLKTKVNKKALAVQVLLGLMVAGNACAVDCSIASAADHLGIVGPASDVPDAENEIKQKGADEVVHSGWYAQSDNNSSDLNQGKFKDGIFANLDNGEVFNGSTMSINVGMGDMKAFAAGASGKTVNFDILAPAPTEYAHGINTFSIADNSQNCTLNIYNMLGNVVQDSNSNYDKQVLTTGEYRISTKNGGSLTDAGESKITVGETDTINIFYAGGSSTLKGARATRFEGGTINVIGSDMELGALVASGSGAINILGDNISIGNTVWYDTSSTSEALTYCSDNGEAKASAVNISGTGTRINKVTADTLTMGEKANLQAHTGNNQGVVNADKIVVRADYSGNVIESDLEMKKKNGTDSLTQNDIEGTYVKGAIFNQYNNPTLSADGKNITTNLQRVNTPHDSSKSLVETQIAAMALTNGSADLLAGVGFANAAQAVKDERESGAAAGEMVPFAAANYGSMRQESGSYVDVDSANFNVGFAKEVKNSNGTLLFGPMIEYGHGNYESHLGDGTIGTGNGQSFGVGVMARQINNDGLYYEGSARYGKSTSDYSSNNLVPGRNISYDNSANYWGVHAGVGKVLSLQGDNSIDVYGKLFYTRQGSSSVDVDGDTLDFDALSSKRSRIGFRYIHGTSKVRSVYAGLAWQYEFDGAARATANGFSTPSPSVKGSSGMLELGVLVAPKASPVSFDLGVSGWAGKQKGYAVNANMCWHF